MSRPGKSTEEALRREKSFVQLLQEIAVAANEATDINSALKTCLERVCAHTGWPIGHAFLLAEDLSGEMVSTGIWYLENPDRFATFRSVTEGTRFAPGIGIVGQVLATRESVWIRDVRVDKNFVRTKTAENIGTRSGYAFPVLIGKEVVAVLEFFSEKVVEPDVKLLEVMTHIGTQLGRVIERKRSEEALIKAREAALEASRAKSEFLANMSHEIRTPINALVGMTGFLLDTQLSSDQKEYVETIKQASDQLLTVINDVLDFSKVESGKIDLEMINFNLSDIVTDTLEVLAFGARAKGIELLSSIEEGLPMNFVGDPSRLRQVLTNLVSNAIKFTHQGRVTVQVRRNGGPDSCDGLVPFRIEVKDTGIGIPSFAAERIFDAFSQADSSTTRKYGGTGLGLSICKKLVEMMGGTIGVESKPHKGSTFRVDLVLPASQLGLDAGLTSKNQFSLVGVRRNARILVAEDNQINQKVAVKMLEKLGYRADAVASGKEAIEALERLPYDLVLMDCQMPEMDGYEATAAIRRLRNPTLRKMPIVAMTANAIKGDREKCLQVGMNDYISKPIDIEILAQVLGKWISQQPERARPRQKKASMQGKREIDQSVLHRLKALQQQGEPDVLVEFIQLFFATTPARLRQIRRYLAEGQLPALAKEAHNLKSSSANLGAESMTHLCRLIEEKATAARMAEAAMLVNQLEEEYLLTKEKLRHLVNDFRPEREAEA